MMIFSCSGENLSIPSRMLPPNINPPAPKPTPEPLSIPSRMLLGQFLDAWVGNNVNFQFLLGCFDIFHLFQLAPTVMVLSIPSRMLPSSNRSSGSGLRSSLSIPSRMLPPAERIVVVDSVTVELSIPSRMLLVLIAIMFATGIALSIPSRMLQL